MTVTSTDSQIQYAGNGSTTVFSIPFTFGSDAEILVTLITDSTNNAVTQTLTTEYSISGSDLTMVTAPASGETLDIRINPDYEQDTDLIANSTLPAETLESTVDDLSKQIKALKAIIDTQCVKLPINKLNQTTVTDTDIVAGNVMQVSADGTKIILDDITVAGTNNGIGGVDEDTSPTLGGTLDTSTYNIKFANGQGLIDGNDNEMALFTTTSSAVNYFNFTNSATGNNVILAPAGDDTNIGITFTAKGSGAFDSASPWNFTGAVDFDGAVTVTGSGTFQLPTGTSVTTDAAGEIALDTDGDGSTIQTGVLQVYDGTQNTYVVSTTNYPSSDNDVPAYDSATNSVTWQAQASGASAGAMVPLDQQTASSSTELDFTSLDTGTYDELILIGSKLKFSSTSADLQLLLSIDGGTSFITSSVYYGAMYSFGTGGWVTDGSIGGTSIKLLDSDYVQSYGVTGFVLRLSNLDSTTNAEPGLIEGTVRGQETTTTVRRLFNIDAYAHRTTTDDYDAIRIKPSTGNISSGVVRLYGIKKS